MLEKSKRPMPSRKKSQKVSLLMVIPKIVITLGAFWILFSIIPFQEVIGKITEANLLFLLASLAISIVIPLIQSRRWNLLIQALDGKISYANTVYLTWLGLFFSSFLPSSIGGDVARAWFARHKGFYFTQSIISVGMDRIFGVSAILLIILLGAPYYYHLLDGSNIGYATSAVVFGSAGCIITVSSIIFADRIPHRLRSKFNFLDQICDCGGRIRQLKVRSFTTYQIAGASILSQILQPLKYYLLALALGAQISFFDFLFLTPFVTLAVAIPVGIAGWGVREGSMIVIFSIVGAQAQDMLAISLLSGFVMALTALPGSLSWLLFANANKQSLR